MLKRQKLSKKKVSQFTGSQPNAGKAFAVFTSTVWKLLKKAIAELNIRQENFQDLSKIHKKLRNFSLT